MPRGGTVEVELRALLDAEDPRTIAEMKADDTEFDGGQITSVARTEHGYSLEWASGEGGTFGIGLTDDKNPDKVEPEVGDQIRVYGRFGSRIHGIDLNGRECFWLTPLERTAEYVQWLADHDRRKREEFAREKPDLDAQYDALPDPLKARIDRFRSESADFRVDSEGYELFCCTEAAKVAQAARDAIEAGADSEAVDEFWSRTDRKPDTIWEDEPESSEARWLLWAWALNTDAYDYDHARQKRLLGLADGHSGNTFGGSMALANALLAGEKV